MPGDKMSRKVRAVGVVFAAGLTAIFWGLIIGIGGGLFRSGLAESYGGLLMLAGTGLLGSASLIVLWAKVLS